MAVDDQIMFLTKAMKDASKKLDFEAAAKLRDEISEVRKKKHAPRQR